MLVQPDGKVLLAAGVGLARFNADGAPDMSFGTGGQVVADFAVADAALTPGGKIVVVGDDLARYTATGTLDTSFGMGGEVIPSFGTIRDVAVQADGRIVVLGGQDLVRYNTDGSLDTSFGSGGVVNIQFGTTLILQANGRLVVAAGDQAASNFELARYNPDGSPDVTFGTSGTVITNVNVIGIPFTLGANVADMALQPDQKIVVAGGIGGNMVLARYDVNGNLDATFGVDGLAVMIGGGLTPGDFPAAVAVQGNGRIVVAGTLHIRDFGRAPDVSRFNPNGSTDLTFNSSGSLVMPNGVAVQADGKILVAASSGISPNTVAAVERLLTDDPLPTASQRFVAQAYLDLLQRPAEPAGLSYWSGLIDQGQATRTQVVSGIEASPEYRAIEVQSFFGLLLNRAATADELSAYGGFLATGGTVEQAEAAVVSSAEYAHNHGDTNDGFLDGLYRDAFGRAVDAGARNALDQALASGTMTRQQVGEVIFGSVEYFGDLVQGFYPHFLHRPADPTGLSNAVNALTSGALGDEGVIAGIVGSDEYLAERT